MAFNIFNMKNFLLITIFLLFTANFYSQKILILDSLSNKPVTFANIEFSDNKGTITNEDGIFKVNSNEQFIISHINYETKNPIDFVLKDTIYLYPISIELDEIVISSFNVIDTLHKVRNRLDKNYITESFNQEGLHRYILKENGLGVEMIETEFLSYSKNRNRPYNARIERVKKTKYYEKFDFFGGLTDVLNKSDISRNSNIVLENPELFNLKFSGSAIKNNGKYYMIDYKAEIKNFNVSGYLILDSDNLAIVEISQKATVIKKNELNNELDTRLTKVIFDIKFKKVGKKGYILSYVNSQNNIDAKMNNSIIDFEFENKIFFTNTSLNKDVMKIKNNFNENKAFNRVVDKFEKKRTWYNDELFPFTNEELQILDDIYK